jgi:hypothetical protein
MPVIRPRIRERIRQQIRDGQQTPAVISDRIVPHLTDAEARAALLIALPYLVRDEIRKFRADALDPERPHRRGEPASRWDPRPVPERVAQAARARRAAGQKAADASQATRDRNAELLRTPIAVAPGEWKTLGECTPGDLRAVAREQIKRATENQRRADGFIRLADKLEQTGAATVADYQGEMREEFVGQ